MSFLKSLASLAAEMARCTDLFVLTEHRNKGIGKALFGYLGKLANERDCGRLDWSVLRVSSQATALTVGTTR